MPSIVPYSGSPSSARPWVRGARKVERLLQLGAREVRAQAVVDAGAEGERLALALGGDVEAVGLAVAVAGERAHEHDRALGEE